MVFTHDSDVSLQGAAGLVNTMAGSVPGDFDVDRLVTREQLDDFVREWRWTGGRTHDDAELKAVRALRPRLRALWLMDEDAAVVTVNALLSEAEALPRLVSHDQLGYHLHATPSDAPLATRMAVEAAMAFVDVIRAGEMDRLRVCAADDCDDVVVDLSKNRSRRFCEGGCGNRANVTAYRARKGRRAAPSPSSSPNPGGGKTER